jgi:hypothetical protein
MTDTAISPLRRRLIEDMTIRRGAVRDVVGIEGGVVSG